jgi:arabinan endo-1,5-alpha-L-arabinosidase
MSRTPMKTVRRGALACAAAATLVAGVAVAVDAQAATAPAPLAAATPTVPPAAHPGPGLVTGDIGAHDPTISTAPTSSGS